VPGSYKLYFIKIYYFGIRTIADIQVLQITGRKPVIHSIAKVNQKASFCSGKEVLHSIRV
jgi:hypothetical protein